eukprot:1137563-Pelagomonas_calceolata.AAC.9
MLIAGAWIASAGPFRDVIPGTQVPHQGQPFSAMQDWGHGGKLCAYITSFGHTVRAWEWATEKCRQKESGGPTPHTFHKSIP